MKNVFHFNQSREKWYFKRFMGWVAIVLTISFLLGLAVDQKAFSQNEPAIKAGENGLSIKSGNQTRQYLLYIPTGYDGKKPLPLVLLFHGAGSTPKAIMELTGLSDVAEKNTFIIAAPKGIYLIAGRNNWNFPLNPGGVNDIEFVKDLIQDISSKVAIDKKRIYSTGFSAGARMTVRLACEIPNDLAAIGVVTNLLSFKGCSDIRPMPIIAFHGTVDLIGIPMKDVEASVAWWAEHNGCNKNPKSKKISEDVTQKSYGECKGSAQVIFYHINKGGHVWPDPPTAEQLVKAGRIKAEEINKDINASNLIWSFFEAHSLP
jgi:polyhydroxybutyrate depolymerase